MKRPSISEHLRSAAVQEAASTVKKQRATPALKFDNSHAATTKAMDGRGDVDYDSDNWVAKYPGLNSPHIGNGPGGPR